MQQTGSYCRSGSSSTLNVLRPHIKLGRLQLLCACPIWPGFGWAGGGEGDTALHSILIVSAITSLKLNLLQRETGILQMIP